MVFQRSKSKQRKACVMTIYSTIMTTQNLLSFSVHVCLFTWVPACIFISLLPVSTSFSLLSRFQVWVLSRLTLCDPITAACQAPLSMGFSRQEQWSGLPFSSPRLSLGSPCQSFSLNQQLTEGSEMEGKGPNLPFKCPLLDNLKN